MSFDIDKEPKKVIYYRIPVTQELIFGIPSNLLIPSSCFPFFNAENVSKAQTVGGSFSQVLSLPSFSLLCPKSLETFWFHRVLWLSPPALAPCRTLILIRITFRIHHGRVSHLAWATGDHCAQFISEHDQICRDLRCSCPELEHQNSISVRILSSKLKEVYSNIHISKAMNIFRLRMSLQYQVLVKS